MDLGEIERIIVTPIEEPASPVELPEEPTPERAPKEEPVGV